MAFAVWTKSHLFVTRKTTTYLSHSYFMKKSNIVYFREESCRYFRAKKKKAHFQETKSCAFHGEGGGAVIFS